MAKRQRCTRAALKGMDREMDRALAELKKLKRGGCHKNVFCSDAYGDAKQLIRIAQRSMKSNINCESTVRTVSAAVEKTAKASAFHEVRRILKPKRK